MALRIAESFEEAVVLGRKIAKEKPQIYSKNTLDNMMERINYHIPYADEFRKLDILYAAVYDWNAYGANINEEFAYKFYDKHHVEKAEYLVGGGRTIYVHHLNGGCNDDKINQLEDKWRLYKRLASYYKREMIKINGAEDYPLFADFVDRHPIYVVKPLDTACGVGVHCADMRGFDSVESAFQELLEDGKKLALKHPSRGMEMVLEELINQEETMASLHPQSVNSLRITTVRIADGEMAIYHPWIKIGMNGRFLASAADNGVIAEIDPLTGMICTDGFNENGEKFITHPNSGIKIKGFQIPQWNELLSLVGSLNREMHEYGYIGWDLVLSKSGWCVMEGNYSGEIVSQVILNKGLRREFEALINWKPEVEYWERYK